MVRDVYTSQPTTPEEQALIEKLTRMLKPKYETEDGRLAPRRAVSSTYPVLAIGELCIWYDTDFETVSLCYYDKDEGLLMLNFAYEGE